MEATYLHRRLVAVVPGFKMHRLKRRKRRLLFIISCMLSCVYLFRTLCCKYDDPTRRIYQGRPTSSSPSIVRKERLSTAPRITTISSGNGTENYRPSESLSVRTDTMRSFQKKYTSPYKVQQLTAAMRKLNKAQRNPWSYDQHQLDTFRRDLFLALKLESGAHPFHLTKRNTPVGSTLPFYQAGKEQRVTKSLWSSLPEDSIVRSDTRFPTCSVVGSSGILLGSRCGEEIDRSEFVIRFNLATVRGFEADVGHKTNLTTLNPTYVRNRFGSLKTEQNISAFKASLEQFHGSLLWLPAFGVRGFQVPLLKVASILAKGDVMTPVYGNPRHFLAVKSLWRPLLKRKKLPTTGLYMLTAAFEFCDHIKLFGAWPFEKSLRNQTVSYHYHDNLAISRHHSFHAEFLQILKLHHLGIIKLQYSECL